MSHRHEGSLAYADTHAQWLATGAPVAAARRRVLASLFGPSEEQQAGRFELRSPLGRGAFGTVWRAFDPMLGREVAVKLVDGCRRPEVAQRFLREARAVASLASENVVEVFDFGMVDGSPYLAMELVEGGSLEHWLREPRPWREVVAAFLGAARGLAAAHAAGIVHRDFKPANVLLGEEGRPRVADFGLAVLADEERSTTAPEPGDPVASTPFAGTPAFMAPEQHLGRPLDHRVDVYAWCASLHLALHGGLPFVGATSDALLQDKRHGRISYAPRGRRSAPRWLRAVIDRGLRADPERRWPTMQALLDAVERGPRSERRRWIAAAGLGASLAVAAGWDRATAPHDCEAEARAELAAGLGPAWREALVASLEARPGLGPDVMQRLDAFAGTWIDARTLACERPTATTDPVVSCLERGLLEASATIDRLREAEPAVLDRARQVVRELADPARCTHARDELIPVDPATEPEVAAIREALATLEVAYRAGLLAPELDRAADVAARAAALGIPALEAEAVLLHGRAQQAAGRLDEAASACEQAHWIASASDLPVLALEGSLCAARVGGLLGRSEQALAWAHQAEVALVRAGRPDLAAARLEDVIAGIHWADGDAPTALVHHDRAIELHRRARPPSPRLHAVALSNRANVLADLGRLDEAIASQRMAVEMLGRELGVQHEHTAAVRCLLGSLLTDTRSPEAIVVLDACIDDLARHLPEDHLWLVQARANRGLAHRVLGDDARALADMEAALRAAQTVAGRVGVELRVGIGTNLGDLHRRRGELDAARERFEAARVLAHDELGRGDPRSLRLAVDVAELEALAPATLEAAQARLREAIELGTTHAQPDLAALARFGLAKLEPPDARALAEAALAHWRERPPGRSEVAPFPESAQERADEIQGWLDAQGSPPARDER